MKNFIAIDFETANPKRVSACALGYARVANGEIVEKKGYLVRPVGGHAPFQSKIHGLKDEHTFDKQMFDELYPTIKSIFQYPIVGHSLFDKQVLLALSKHFDLDLNFNYTDSSKAAKECLPGLSNHKLRTLAKHFGLPAFKHHDAAEDAHACAMIFLNLHGQSGESEEQSTSSDAHEFRGLATGILADDEVNYKEVYALLYWLEDHSAFSQRHQNLYDITRQSLSDDYLDSAEEEAIKELLKRELNQL
jgi:DNA polymerase-3 subunit epsilon